MASSIKPIAACIAFLCAAAPEIGQAKEWRNLITHEELVAQVSAEDWCAEKIQLRIIAPDRSVFRGDRLELQKLVGGAQAPLTFKCSDARSASLTGIVDGRRVFRGTVDFTAGGKLMSARLLNGAETETAKTADAVPSDSSTKGSEKAGEAAGERTELKSAPAVAGSPGSIPDLADEFSLNVEPRVSNFDIDQLPPGLALAVAVRPFREDKDLLKKDGLVAKFAQQFDCAGFEKASKNEFRAREFAEEWRDRIRGAMQRIPDQSGYRMTLPVVMSFGTYDFEQGGFPVDKINSRFRLARLATSDCVESAYGGAERVMVEHRVNVLIRVPDSWTPVLDLPEPEARQVAEAYPKERTNRTAHGSVDVQTVALRRGKHGFILDVAPVGPFRMGLEKLSDIQWSLEPPRPPRVDGLACKDEPKVSRTRKSGLDGLPYRIVERRCILMKNEELRRGDLEVEPIDDPVPLRYTDYRAGLALVAERPGLLEGSGSQELLTEIVKQYQTSYQKMKRNPNLVLSDRIGVAPNILDASRVPLNRPADSLARGKLGEDVKAHIRKSARELPKRFIAPIGRIDVRIDRSAGLLRLEEGHLLEGRKQPDNRITYKIPIDQSSGDGPVWTGLPNPPGVKLGVELKSPNLRLPEARLARIAELLGRDRYAHGYLIFKTAGTSSNAEEKLTLTGELERVELMFHGDDSGTRTRQNAAETISIPATDFPAVRRRTPPLTVNRRMPNPSSLHGREPAGVEFGRPIEPIGQAPGNGVRLQCGGLAANADRDPIDVKAEANGSTLRLLPVRPLKGFSGGLCEYKVDVDVVKAKNDGGRLEEPVTYKFKINDYETWSESASP